MSDINWKEVERKKLEDLRKSGEELLQIPREYWERMKVKRTVTEKALIARINRKLKKDSERLCKTRGQQARSNLGDYYILDWYRNWIVAYHCDLEGLGRELEVLGDEETVVYD